MNAKDELLASREFLYGRKWDEDAGALKSIGQGALDGSNDKRLEILNVIRKSSLQDSLFLNELRKFLDATHLDMNAETLPAADSLATELREFARAWRRVCDIPRNLDRAEPGTTFTVFECLKITNQFRNRFAHVPFSSDPLTDLRVSLERLTEMIFSIRPLPCCDLDKGRASVLTGCMVKGKDQWRGAYVFLNRGAEDELLHFGYPARKPDELWAADPFAFVDSSKRTYVLTRLVREDEGSFEYTRFFGEGDAITTNDNLRGLALIAPIEEADYPQQKDVMAVVVPTPQVSEAPSDALPTSVRPAIVVEVSTYAGALQAIRLQEYDRAIPFLRDDVKHRPNYHPAWLKLGFALREKAGRDCAADHNQAFLLLKEAHDAFTRALRHTDVGYQATAYYERSKVSFRLYSMQSPGDWARDAWKDANHAAQLEPEDRYLTWVDFLARNLPVTAQSEVTA
ncbi:MAG: hypothetical protein U0936_22165 [Planctomycetaceae bacterium]